MNEGFDANHARHREWHAQLVMKMIREGMGHARAVSDTRNGTA